MRSRSIALALVATLALPVTTYAQPPALDTDQEAADPYEQPMFVAGALTLLTSYGLSFGVAATSLDRDNRGLYFPVAGPWIALDAHHPCETGCDQDTIDDVLLVADGIAQAAGVALMVTSLIRSERVRARGVHLAVTARSVGIAAKF